MLLLSVLNTQFYSQQQLEVLRNIPSLQWKPEIPTIFKDFTKEQIQNLYSEISTTEEIEDSTEEVVIDRAPPASFDWRVAGPHCIGAAPATGSVCNSDWVFASQDVMSDSRCIFKRDSTKPVRKSFSAQAQLNCDISAKGCKGGDMSGSIGFLYKMGVPLADCLAYRSGLSGAVSKCTSICDNNKVWPDTYTIKTYKNVCKGKNKQESIMYAVATAPVRAQFDLYEDFMYFTGKADQIYHHVSGNRIGTKHISIVGYGTQNETAYWLIKNTWGPQWGDNGFFKIQRQNNECGIENKCFSIDP